MPNPETTIAADVQPCRTCRFWHREQEQYTYGLCRRWPPRAGLTVHAAKAHAYDRIEVTMATTSAAEWPNSAESDGCGEHRERRVE